MNVTLITQTHANMSHTNTSHACTHVTHTLCHGNTREHTCTSAYEHKHHDTYSLRQLPFWAACTQWNATKLQ